MREVVLDIVSVLTLVTTLEATPAVWEQLEQWHV